MAPSPSTDPASPTEPPRERLQTRVALTRLFGRFRPLFWWSSGVFAILLVRTTLELLAPLLMGQSARPDRARRRGRCARAARAVRRDALAARLRHDPARRRGLLVVGRDAEPRARAREPLPHGPLHEGLAPALPLPRREPQRRDDRAEPARHGEGQAVLPRGRVRLRRAGADGRRLAGRGVLHQLDVRHGRRRRSSASPCSSRSASGARSPSAIAWSAISTTR